MRDGRAVSGVVAEQDGKTLTLRTLAMPADVNVSGDIFGGWVLSQMDIAAGSSAGSAVRSV